MKSIPLTITIPAFTITCEAMADAGAAAPAEDSVAAPAPDSPELQILNHYAGSWAEQISGKPGVRRRDVGEWILDGRFLRQTWASETQEDTSKASGMTLMTYDRERSIYRSWAFLATGSVIENEGSWDPKSQTMTWGHRVPGSTEMIFTKVTFRDETNQQWSIVKTDADGTVLKEVSGTSERRGREME